MVGLIQACSGKEYEVRSEKSTKLKREKRKEERGKRKEESTKLEVEIGLILIYIYENLRKLFYSFNLSLKRSMLFRHGHSTNYKP